MTGKDGAARASRPLGVRADADQMDASPEGLGAGLRRLRANGDLAAAAQVFKRLFPAETASDPIASIKTAVIPLSGLADDDAGSAKPVPAREGATPVFVSPEREKNPSADIGRAGGEDWAIFSAAEQWAGGEPGTIRVRKSSDQGRTWPATLVIGAARPLTRPSIRQVSDDAIGLVFATEWDFGDGRGSNWRLRTSKSHQDRPTRSPV